MTHPVTQANAQASRPAVHAIFSADAALLEGIEKMIAFNMQVGKALIQESAQAYMSSGADNPGSAASWVAGGLRKSNMEKVEAYCRHVQSVNADMQVELAKVMQTYVTETEQQWRALFNNYMRPSDGSSTPHYDASFQVWLNAFSKLGEDFAKSTETSLKNFADVTSAALKPSPAPVAA